MSKNFHFVEKEYGNHIIEKMRVIRKPITGGSILKKFSTGRLPAHDDIYHLLTEISVRNPLTNEKNVIMIERNQTVKAMTGREGGGEIVGEEGVSGREVDLPSHVKGKMTYGEFIQNSRHYHNHIIKQDMGTYDLRYNNCQDFTMVNLRASGIEVPSELREFVWQDAQGLVPKWAGNTVRKITDFAKWFSDKKESYEYKQPEHLRKNYIAPMRAEGMQYQHGVVESY